MSSFFFNTDMVISFLVLQAVGMHLDGLHTKVAIGTRQGAGRCAYVSMYLSIALMPHSLRERPLQESSHSRKVSASPYPNSFLACFSIPPLVAPLSHVLFFCPSIWHMAFINPQLRACAVFFWNESVGTLGYSLISLISLWINWDLIVSLKDSKLSKG